MGRRFFGELFGCLQVQRPVWSLAVVVVPPVLEDHPALAQRVEQLTVQTLGPKPAIEALHVAVLPRAARIDIDRLDLVLPEPFLDRLGDELRSVVTADLFWGAVLLDHLLQQRQDIGRSDSAVGMNAMALPRVFVH